MKLLKHHKILPLATLMLMSFNALAGDVDKTLDWVLGGELKVDITAGHIEIKGWDKDQVKLTGNFSGDDERLIFKQSGKNITLELKDEHSSWWGNSSGGSVDFTVLVPVESNLDIKGTSLRIEVEKVTGNLEISSISGSVAASGASNRINIETVSGDVDISDASGKIRLHTVSGDINANAEALTFEAKSVSGDIEGNIRSEYATMLSVSGDVNIELSLLNDGRIEGQTVSGNLELNFNQRLNAEFKLNTGPGGDINNRLSKHKPEDGNHWGQELNFTLGDGDSTVDLETMSGTIKLR